MELVPPPLPPPSFRGSKHDWESNTNTKAAKHVSVTSESSSECEAVEMVPPPPPSSRGSKHDCESKTKAAKHVSVTSESSGLCDTVELVPPPPPSSNVSKHDHVSKNKATKHVTVTSKGSGECRLEEPALPPPPPSSGPSSPAAVSTCSSSYSLISTADNSSSPSRYALASNYDSSADSLGQQLFYDAVGKLEKKAENLQLSRNSTLNGTREPFYSKASDVMEETVTFQSETDQSDGYVSSCFKDFINKCKDNMLIQKGSLEDSSEYDALHEESFEKRDSVTKSGSKEEIDEVSRTTLLSKSGKVKVASTTLEKQILVERCSKGEGSIPEVTNPLQ